MGKQQNKNQKIDVAILALIPIAAFLLTMWMGTNLLITTVLFFGLPALYLSLRNRAIFIKSTIFALIFTLPLSFFVDVLAVLDQSWIVPHTVFPFKFFGVATVEVFIFSLLWSLFAILFYEHFFDRGKRGDRIDKKMRYLLYLFAFLIGLVAVAYGIDLSLIRVPYFFLVVGLVFVAPPVVVFLYHYPMFLKRFTVVGIYFFFVTILFEITALDAGQWIYPSEHVIGYVELFGYRFPFEEFVFWVGLAAPSILAYYEFFADDRRA